MFARRGVGVRKRGAGLQKKRGINTVYALALCFGFCCNAVCERTHPQFFTILLAFFRIKNMCTVLYMLAQYGNIFGDVLKSVSYFVFISTRKNNRCLYVIYDNDNIVFDVVTMWMFFFVDMLLSIKM
jgi:hypothetical protein